MKRILCIFTAAVLLFTCAIAGGASVAFAEETEEPAAEEIAAEEPAAAEPAAEETEESAETEEPAPEEPIMIPDYDAMFAVYDPAKVVMTVGGREITWQDYYAIYYLYARDIANSFEMMQTYYGLSQSWDDVYNVSNGMTYADYAAYGTENELEQMALFENMAESRGVSLTEEQTAEMQKGILAAAQESLGEDATLEDYYRDLERFYVSEEMYNRMVGINSLISNLLEDEFGAEGEKMSAEDVAAQLDKSGFMTAKHILFMTINRDTGETIDEDSIREAKAKAEEIAAELQAIEDDAERKAKFDEYEAEYNDDPGRAVFTDGYTFVEGTMYPVFEEAVKALGDWEVSDSVESTSGYHVIMRLPLSEDALILYTDGNTYTARSVAVNDAFDAEFHEAFESTEIVFAEDFEVPNPANFLIEKIPAETAEAAE